MVSELHILNGDFALKIWEQCGFQGTALVWLETYLEGPLPETEDLDTFRKARAAFLATFEETKEIGFERLCSHLQRMDDTLLTESPQRDVMLWFDSCIFDQTLLMRILYLLHGQKSKRRVSLYCSGNNCLTAEDFRQGAQGRFCLTAEEIRYGACAWRLFQRRDAEGMKQLAREKKFDRMPAMEKALYRCAEDVPDGDGLTRTQRQILQLAAEGEKSFREIFTALDRFEEYPFLGDTACQRLLDHLTARGKLCCSGGRYRTKGSTG